MRPINFQQYSDSDLIQEYNDINCRRVRKLTLERIEEVCKYYGNPSSEKDVSYEVRLIRTNQTDFI